jgi:hypothetical protein
MPTTTTDRPTRDTVLAQRVLVRDMPDRSRIVATLRIDHLAGNAHPYFSATADVYEAHGTHSGAVRQRTRRDADGGGADHAAILRAFPGALPFVHLHLSDWPSGVPMHAEANAWYVLTGECARYETKHYGPEWPLRHGNGPTRAARILRLTGADDLPYDVLRAHAAGTLDGDETLRARFARFVDEQRPRWAAEARAAHDLLDMIPDLYALRGYDGSGKPCERVALPSWLIGADPEHVDL